MGELWRGEVGLAKTYWVWGVLVNGVLGVIGLFIVISIGSVPLLLAYVALSVLFSIFMCVAIWRSAGNYTGPTIWMVLARIAVILGMLNLIFNMLRIFSGDI